ncbi:putative ERCC4 domain-containing protein [Cryptosporidium felis]|nr:putative ERCC4 domain-containing protein [Cryptosporidium felis]
MNWETNKLRIELSENLISHHIGKHIIRNLVELGAYCVEGRNLEKDNSVDSKSIIFESTKLNDLIYKIPCCKVYPKFEYESHIEKFRKLNYLCKKKDSTFINNTILNIVILFVTIEVYDKISEENTNYIGELFGSRLIDLLYSEASSYCSSGSTRCIVIWIGTRDLLSQELLLDSGTSEIPNDDKFKKRNCILEKKYGGQSCLDKCITFLIVNHSVDSFEVKNELEASQYLSCIITAIHESQKRPISSKYKPKNNTGSNDNSWITQLVQIPGLSDDSARAIEKLYSSPKEIIRFIKRNINDLVPHNSDKFVKQNIGILKKDIEDSSWFNQLSNITFFCSKSFSVRRLGRARARKLVLLYGNITPPTKIIAEDNYFDSLN